MSTQTKVTKGVRIRRAGKTSEWVIARHSRSGKRMAQVEAVSRGRQVAPSRRKQSMRTTEELAFIRELMAAEDLETQEETILMVSAADPQTLEKAKALLELMSQRLEDLEDAEMGKLIDAVMPAFFDRPSSTVIDQARRNAEVRTKFIASCEMLDAEQVHQLFGSSARNRAALAARWRADGKLFAVEHQGRLLYPGFQFNQQGRPKPIIGKVLAALGSAVGPWQTAIWFTTGNAWLDGRKPVDLLDSESKRVLDAASDIAEPVAH